MAKFPRSAKLAIVKANGASFWRFYTLTSSNITTSAQGLTTAATGRLAITSVIVKTDATGLAGGTNFELKTNNAKGAANFAVETVANLGANITKSFGGPPAGDTTTSDAGFTVTQAVTVLETGKQVQFDMTSSVGTGAGTVDIAIKFERIDENADIL